jgi:type IV secretory pathway protease TraF
MIGVVASRSSSDDAAMRQPARIIALVALCLAAGFSVLGRVEPLIIYNESPSAPVGFYIRDGAAPGPGRFVTVRASAVAPGYARLRGFDDASDRFIKRVAAGPGAQICARGDEVTIGGSIALPRQSFDALGRPLPAWSECRALGADEFFLLGATPSSFDSRYWGPVRADTIDGVWRPIGQP